MTYYPKLGILIYILFFINLIESNNFNQLVENRGCPIDRIPVLSKDANEIECVECTGVRKQKSYLCLKNHIKDTSIECSNYIDFPQCPPYTYCDYDTYKCQKFPETYEYTTVKTLEQKVIDPNSPLYYQDYYGHYHIPSQMSFSSSNLNQCPEGLLWSNELTKCVQCHNRNHKFPRIDSNDKLEKYSFVQNYECQDGYKVHKLPLNELIKSDPYILFTLFVLCILIYTLVIKIILEFKHYIQMKQ